MFLKGPIDQKSSFVQAMVLRQICDKPLTEPVRHFADDTCKCIFCNESTCILIWDNISLKYVFEVSTNMSTFLSVMA